MSSDEAASVKAAAAFLQESLDARLIAALDVFTARDLVQRRPQDTETLQHLGVAATNADRFVRPWVNSAFRIPSRFAPLGRGKLPTTTTFAKLRDFCTKA